MTRMPGLLLLASLLFLTNAAWGQGKASPQDTPKATDKTVEQLAEQVRPSIVVVRVAGRDGGQQGLGTGFVISADGLIATNLHVIGEARPITVELADGKIHEVTHVHASDRAQDLAIIRIDAQGLPPLPLGDSATLKDGQAIVAIGNPRGLLRSVVAGVVSGQRDIDGRQMIQLAIPIETGNSGGPVLDLQGRVHGITTIKSLVTDNLGFAVPINTLKPLLKKPNPIPMSRWLRIGALDGDEWKALFGSRWRQRAGGSLLVDGMGEGLGGRSLCLWQKPVPDVPFEVVVTVRLDDESGAAGLVFHADGEHKHYGFYPSSGELRLARFEGPDVFSWRVLEQKPSPHYQPGTWNTLKVRVEKNRIQCYVNGHLLMESTDTAFTKGQVGLAKFRHTRAEFKHFQVGKEIAVPQLPAGLTDKVMKSVAGLSPRAELQPALIDSLTPEGPASVAVLRERAKQLEEQAEQLRRLALAVHHKRVQTELAQVMSDPEDAIDLLHAALLIAKLDNDDLDVAAYRKAVERMAQEIQNDLPKKADDQTKLATLNKYLFEENGFHGSRGDYYHRANSYLDRVIDEREGLPITLSVLYMDLGRRLGLRIEGVGLPGHFVVRHVPAKGEPQLIDVYEGGVLMSRADANRKVEGITDEPPRDEHFQAVSKQAIVIRMLHNLMNLARRDADAEALARYLDAILTLNPKSAEERFMRAAVRLHLNHRQGALEDAEWLLDHQPDGVDLDAVRRMYRLLSPPGQ